MPKSRSKRRLPVTAQRLSVKDGSNGDSSAANTVIAPPIHVAGQEKIILDPSALAGIAREKLGKSSAETRRRINRFHTLIKEQSKLAAKRITAISPESIDQIQKEISEVSEEMARMGGLDWYQKASLLGQCKQRGGDTSRWLVPKLNELGFGKGTTKEPLRLLDVGALSCRNYTKERAWIRVTPIDLNSQEPGIYKQDFLDINPDFEVLKTPTEDKESTAGENSDSDGDNETENIAHLFRQPFDVICLSLVVNFIGDPAKRGDMLKQAKRLLVPSGLLFFVLPLSCVINSRYFNDDRLLAIMQFLGFEQLYAHHTAKLAHYLYRLIATPTSMLNCKSSPQFKKKLLHSAPGRNNFSIVV
ncbi:25S rRNA (adenine2142-N1)-methyltransferase [Coemansia spiralis]|uniref:25S rRNA adenine-N(1) methyltransferase n=2 Tax=Coemansia TaxID=4863 RepID=A0A9W8L148_9FUNG|nr:25S rRNA (adenine2142-N1)-methyltransferase [Coemansia umbellata]KAJ2621956.1 25S rRNA (adenine2142-N1)-methyltransferase [Coemansia sp. RSA 1358]KAJ2680462.1 25S rRNA (adenine2142-N1)-methyltransferase [Coemansia spiralis]